MWYHKAMKKISGGWAGAFIAGFLFFGAALVASAATTLSLTNPLGAGSTVNGVITSIGAFMVALAVPICGIMVIVGAFQMMTAAGDPTKFSNGRKTLLYAAIGFVIVLFASSVSPLIKSVLGG